MLKLKIFANIFLSELKVKFIESGISKRNRNHIMTAGKIITILIYFNYNGMKNFKAYYLGMVQHEMKRYFPIQLSYSRFIAIVHEYLFVANAFMQYKLSTNNSAATAFVDSTSLAVCTNKRISSHKVFDTFATIGKTTKGWFLGFKHRSSSNAFVYMICVIIAYCLNPNKPSIKFTTQELKLLDSI